MYVLENKAKYFKEWNVQVIKQQAYRCMFKSV